MSQLDSLRDATVYAQKYLSDILSFFDLNSDVTGSSEDGEVIELDIPTSHLNGFLIGQRGETMRALQFVVSSALKTKGFAHYRVNVDVAGYKKQRADRLAETAAEWIAQVKSSGEAYALQPMNAADRRTIHRVANDAGLSTESVGEGRERHIVIKPSI